MKKHEIIKTGYDKYIKGTRFKCIETKDEIVSNGNFIINGYNRLLHVNENNLGKGVVCKVIDCELKWAEIVKPKIAVKVENEKEFKALMKYYDSLGYVWNGGGKPLSKESLPSYPNAIKFEDKFQHSTGKECADYQIIPFAEFAKEKGIKLPLHKSVDGVDLYEDDPYVMVKNIPATNNEWKITREDVKLKETHFPITDPDRCLAFSTKQAALSWIEAQKPKNVIISPDSSYPIIVYRNPVCGNEYIHLDMSKRGDYNGANIHLTIHELRQALKAYDEMHS